MNTLVRNIHDNEPMNDGPLNFAVKPTRLPEHDHSPGGEAPRVNFPPPDELDELKASEPPWKQNKQPSVFAREVAVAGVGVRRSLAPDRIPDLQFPNSGADPRRARNNRHHCSHGIGCRWVPVGFNSTGYVAGAETCAQPRSLGLAVGTGEASCKYRGFEPGVESCGSASGRKWSSARGSHRHRTQRGQ